MKTLVTKEWGDHSHRVQCVVVHELGQGEDIDPIILLVVDVHLKILFQDLVDSFGLTVHLRVIGSSDVSLDP